MRRIQVIPKGGFQLYTAMVAKQGDIARNKRGTFVRRGRRGRGQAQWSHKNYPGWIKLARGTGGMLEIELHPKDDDGDWKLMQAILGFLNRHFGDEISAINMQY